MNFVKAKQHLADSFADTTLNFFALETALRGIILAILLKMIYGHIYAREVILIATFLAIFSMVRIFLSPRYIVARFWAKLLCIIIAIGSGWSLVYQAEQVRAGYFRFHVLQQRISGIVSKAPVYAILSNCDGQITEASENIHNLTGYTRQELLGKPVTILMRPGASHRHLMAYRSAIRDLRNDQRDATGWMLEGERIVGVKRKDGKITPVKVYAGGIRWSGDVQFQGDIDMFAIMCPTGILSTFTNNSNIGNDTPVTISPKAKSEIPSTPPPRVRFVPDSGNRDPRLEESPPLPEPLPE